MDKDPFWANVFPDLRTKEKTENEILKQIPLFSDCTRNELNVVLRYLHTREFKAEELIFEENKPGLGMYIILEGRVEIYFKKDHKALAVLGRGEFFGEMALLQEAPRSASAAALEDTRMFGLFQPDLFGLIENKPALGSKILVQLARMIAERLRLSNQENYQLKQKIVKNGKK